MQEHRSRPAIKYALVESYTNENYAEIVLQAEQTLFRVRIVPQLDSPESHLVSRMYEPSGESLRRLVEKLGSLCQPFFRAHARYRGDDLDSELRDNTQIFLQLKFKGRCTELSELPQEQQPCEEYPVRHKISTDLPSYQLSAVKNIRTFHERRTYEVSINGTRYFCRIAPGRFDHMFQNEFNVLRRIKKCGLSLRVPELKGFVGVEEQIPGMLETFIPHQSRLSDVDLTVADLEERCKWVTQIEDTVRKLHHYGIVWGRVRASNVLIDHHRDAWIVDFQESLLRLEPFDIDEVESMDRAMKKDLEGLDKINEFLHLSA
ncbi:hypothetical protein BO94DRAFT_610471 [Aspergillus sclerotioniger CBS 115572]|uniref:Protein kinase domain-containing protein n=1 Tax=Aspergillus sclerotioniger CBS 115572 TaxID=1450535 RepID=A0A317XB75_9EURO|nr:hypothetical protein BO94DRAFT_610471 [Aspergillus sclerotioniger CBS 115572]PWY94847.1 hypothetical protein BO94DRAFT_610471 [Aspergillus sclerotioniger CBS 115572]